MIFGPEGCQPSGDVVDVLLVSDHADIGDMLVVRHGTARKATSISDPVNALALQAGNREDTLRVWCMNQPHLP